MKVITTARLTLRPMQESDWPAVHAYASDAAVCRFLEWGPNTATETRAFVARTLRLALERPRLYYDFAITRPGKVELFGNVSVFVHDDHNQQGSLGYVLNSTYWGQGYMPEALQAVIGFAFTNLGLHRLSATCDEDNIASVRVLEKCGLRCEGRFLEDKLVKGRWRNTLVYSLLQSERSPSPVISNQ